MDLQAAREKQLTNQKRTGRTGSDGRAQTKQARTSTNNNIANTSEPRDNDAPNNKQKRMQHYMERGN